MLRGERFERISGLSWGRTQRADWIVFAWKPNGECESLRAVEAPSGRVVRLTSCDANEGIHFDSTPAWTSQGDLLFASSRGGVYNLYRLSTPQLDQLLQSSPDLPTRSERAVPWVARTLTHFETGGLFPVENAQGKIWASVYGVNGFDLAKVDAQELKPLVSVQKPPHELDTQLRIEWPDPEQDHPPGQVSEYSSHPSIWPRYWVPGFARVTSWLVGGRPGIHARERHSYDLNARDSRALSNSSRWLSIDGYPMWALAVQGAI